MQKSYQTSRISSINDKLKIVNELMPSFIRDLDEPWMSKLNNNDLMNIREMRIEFLSEQERYEEFVKRDRSKSLTEEERRGIINQEKVVIKLLQSIISFVTDIKLRLDTNQYIRERSLTSENIKYSARTTKKRKTETNIDSFDNYDPDECTYVPDGYIPRSALVNNFQRRPQAIRQREVQTPVDPRPSEEQIEARKKREFAEAKRNFQSRVPPDFSHFVDEHFDDIQKLVSQNELIEALKIISRRNRLAKAVNETYKVIKHLKKC